MYHPAIVWLLLSLIWGSTWLFIKVGLADLPPFTFAGLRFAVAIVPLAALVAVRRPPVPLPLRDWAFMGVTGIMTFAITYGLVFWGEQYISSGLAALLFATFPLFGLVIAHAFLPAEQMTRRKVLGVLLGISGVAIVLSNQLRAESAMALWGSAAVVVAALTSASADVWIKLRARRFDPVLLTLVQMVVGAMPLLAMGVAIEGNPMTLFWTPIAVIALLYLAIIGSALAFVLLYWLIQHMDVTKTMLITLVTPLVAVLLGMVVLRESLGWRTATGGAAIIGGLALTLRGRPPRRVSPSVVRRASPTAQGRGGRRDIRRP